MWQSTREASCHRASDLLSLVAYCIDRRLILTCQPRRTTRKIFASSVERILLWSRWQQNTAGPIKRPSSSTNTFLHNITGSVASCYKSHRLSSSLWPLNYWYVVSYTTIMRRFKVRPFFTWNLYQPSSVTSSISDDPSTQFIVKPFFAIQASAWSHLYVPAT